MGVGMGVSVQRFLYISVVTMPFHKESDVVGQKCDTVL